MSLLVAQFSDCHLFSDSSKRHVGANVYDNLKRVLAEISQNHAIDLILFTGDLTQDHTTQSYQLFANLVRQAGIKKPLYYLAGNHDEPQLLNQYLVGAPFNESDVIESDYWQLFLLPSKSETPAGFIQPSLLDDIERLCQPTKFQWLFMHHHPINVGYFIDRHPLTNQEPLWQMVGNQATIKGIACGHIHQGLNMLAENTGKSCDVLTCPATSIQFDPSIDGVAALPLGPGYRLIELHDNGSYDTDIIYL